MTTTTPTPAPSPSPTFAALLAAVVRHPGEMVPLGMLADHCEESGERPELAAGLRALGRLEKFPALWWEDLDGAITREQTDSFSAATWHGEEEPGVVCAMLGKPWRFELRGWTCGIGSRFAPVDPSADEYGLWRDYPTPEAAVLAAAEAWGRLSAAERAEILG